MKASKLGLILAVSYLILLGLSIAYELSIRIYDRGNSEFAGMLSTALTFTDECSVDLGDELGLRG